MHAHARRTPFRRRHAFAFALALSFSLVVLSGLSYSRAQEPEPEEREVVDKIPKHLPIKFKIKKPEKLKDAKNNEWLDDMEIEVTNTGTKPIYRLSIHLVMPDVLHESGKKYGFTYKLGRIELADFGEPVRPDDVPLRPGETVTLNPPANTIEGWKGAREEGRAKNPKKIEFIFVQINFGDGTGFAGRSGMAMPVPRQRSSNDPRTGGGGGGAQAAGAADPPPKTFMDTSCTPRPTQPPVSFLPAAFSRADFTVSSADVTAALTPARDICCQTSRPECVWIKPGGQTCICGEIDVNQFPACSDPFGTCATIEYSVRACKDSTGFEHYCEESTLGDPCDSPTPNPTPTPTPTPTPGSTPTPSPTPKTIPCPSPKPADCCQPKVERLPGLDPYCVWDCTPCGPGTPLPDGCVTAPIPTCGDGFLWAPVYGGVCCPAPPPPPPGDDLAWGGGCPEGCVWSFGAGYCVQVSTGGPCQSSPILVDVAGDGFALTDARGGVDFDLDGDGRPERLSWTRADSDDAWLALDRDGDGMIEGGRELFGNFTPQPAPPAGQERNGFLALAEFDRSAVGGNGDGVIDRGDAVFAHLRLWCDSNHDGVSQPKELHTLPALGVVRLHLDYKESKRTDAHGNHFRYRAKAEDARGARGNRWAWDVFLLRAP